jgi:hypothetical protein
VPTGFPLLFATQKGRGGRMGWFRSNRVGVTLACHFLLSFGHVHAGKFDDRSVVFAALETGDADGPPSQKRNGLAGDFCAICANISLSGTLILPVLAIILAPRLFAEILPWSLTASQPASPDHLPFSARGPPHA